MLKLPIPLIKVLLNKVNDNSKAELKSITRHFINNSPFVINLTEEEGKTYIWLMDIISLSVLGWYSLGTFNNVRVRCFTTSNIYVDSFCEIQVSINSFTSTLTNYNSDYYKYISKLKELYVLLSHTRCITGNPELNRFHKNNIETLESYLNEKIKQLQNEYSEEMINYIKELCSA